MRQNSSTERDLASLVLSQEADTEELEQRCTAQQDVISGLRTELAESRAQTTAIERMRAALEKDLATVRKDAAARDELHAKMLADMRAMAEAMKVAPAAPLCGYSLKVVSRDGNNDPQEYRIVPDKS